MNESAQTAPVARYRPPDVLSLKQRLFIDTYLACGQNGRQAYLKLHPKAKVTTAEVQASKYLRLHKVSEEIARRVRYSLGITKEQIESDLLWCTDRAKQAEDYEALASISMDKAKLAGFLVEKREVKTVSDDEAKAIRALVRQSLTTTGSGLGTVSVPAETTN